MEVIKSIQGTITENGSQFCLYFLYIEPNFIFADVIRADPESPDEDDDKVYFFFTEVSVEYEFLNKLMIPRIARVCKVGHSVNMFYFFLGWRKKPVETRICFVSPDMPFLCSLSPRATVLVGLSFLLKSQTCHSLN